MISRRGLVGAAIAVNWIGIARNPCPADVC